MVGQPVKERAGQAGSACTVRKTNSGLNTSVKPWFSSASTVRLSPARMVILNKGRKRFAKAARAGKKINHSECRRQIKLLTNFRQLRYTG